MRAQGSGIATAGRCSKCPMAPLRHRAWRPYCAPRADARENQLATAIATRSLPCLAAARSPAPSLERRKHPQCRSAARGWEDHLQWMSLPAPARRANGLRERWRRIPPPRPVYSIELLREREDFEESLRHLSCFCKPSSRNPPSTLNPRIPIQGRPPVERTPSSLAAAPRTRIRCTRIDKLAAAKLHVARRWDCRRAAAQASVSPSTRVQSTCSAAAGRRQERTLYSASMISPCGTPRSGRAAYGDDGSARARSSGKASGSMGLGRVANESNPA